MKRTHLCADMLYKVIGELFQKIPETRKLENITTSTKDALLSGLALFALKSPSLLSFENEVSNPAQEENLKKLFGIDCVPSDTSMRRIVDLVDSESIKSAFKKIFTRLQRGKALEEFRYLGGHYLISLDGTGFFSSKKVHCDGCLEAHHKNGDITYKHQMLAAALVHPGKKEVIALAPEPIVKQDGSSKNDCERNAGRRLIEQIRREHPHLKMIIIEDALSGNVPRVKLLQSHNLRFILGIKPGGHSDFFERMSEENLSNNFTEFKTLDDKGIEHNFSFSNNQILNQLTPEIKINFLDYTEINTKGKITHFTWITDLKISKDNVFEIMRGGRARWKIENEVFNTLKNSGYHFEHNFGHGKKNLSNNFAILMLLAFLIDQTQWLTCKEFQTAKVHLGTWRHMWAKILATVELFVIPSWEKLYQYIGKNHKLLSLPP